MTVRAVHARAPTAVPARCSDFNEGRKTMRSSTSNGKVSGLATFSLCAALMLPGVAGAAITACRAASVPDSEQAAQEQSEFSKQESEYLRLHREVVAPFLFRDLGQAADPAPEGAGHRVDHDRSGHRCDSVLGDRKGGVAGVSLTEGSRA
jgi:hypothetical protein